MSTSEEASRASSMSKKPRAKPPSGGSSSKASNSASNNKTMINLDDAMEVVLASNMHPSGECTVLVQIDTEDAKDLEFEGSQGVIGRIETDEQGVILDLKGRQYRGRIFPGPTALVMSLSTKTGAAQLKVDAITDEFVRVEALGQSMDKFDAKTHMHGDMEEYFVDEDEDVNRNSKSKSVKATASEPSSQTERPSAKRQASHTAGAGNAKKKKTTKTK